MKKTRMLKKNYEFRRVLSKGKYYSGKYIEALVMENKKPINLIGLAISVKVGKAVKRNKIKRLIRESYKNAESQLSLGYSIVFLWKKDKPFEENATFENVNRDIIKILEKSNILSR